MLWTGRRRRGYITHAARPHRVITRRGRGADILLPLVGRGARSVGRVSGIHVLDEVLGCGSRGDDLVREATSLGEDARVERIRQVAVIDGGEGKRVGVTQADGPAGVRRQQHGHHGEDAGAVARRIRHRWRADVALCVEELEVGLGGGGVHGVAVGGGVALCVCLPQRVALETVVETRVCEDAEGEGREEAGAMGRPFGLRVRESVGVVVDLRVFGQAGIVDGVEQEREGVILEILADAAQWYLDVNMVLLQEVRGTDAGTLQDGRRVVGAGCEDDFFTGRDDMLVGIVDTRDDACRSEALALRVLGEKHTIDSCFGCNAKIPHAVDMGNLLHLAAPAVFPCLDVVCG